MAALVSLKANCYVCDRPFVRARKLRSHLFHQHASDASHSLIAVHYECPSCFGHYAAIDELKAHVTVHVRNTHHGSKKRNAPTSGEEPNDDFGFDSSSSAQERTIICKKTKVSYLGSHDDPPPEVQEPPDIESDEEGTGLGLRSMLFLWAYRLRESKPIEGIDAVIKTRKVDLASFTGRLIGISIDIMQKWQSENYLDEKLKETLRTAFLFHLSSIL
ncbi:uncharacterized protein BYT42DRAFT_131539 [Radiomyces spectabilis]|uniref:uncharacterized protein n=1 Tax=Radiomyces spectabilis TaxID=64574 RepID=UPI00221E9415|nr:uncharacterized protein BYT42DRAFT_131539 [Radiomyces spectabilis]KAI8367573.1 hypothetical protein BYT42DRAFT_131539 [Radiomyces spectabilis]